VLFHEGSTVVVVLNAMRLLVYRAPSTAPAATVAWSDRNA
jgi:hypothetical protein